MLGEESRLDTCAAILTQEQTSSQGLSNYPLFNVNTILAAEPAAEPREEVCVGVCVCVKEIRCVSNMDDVRAIREHMNHHWGGNDLGAPRRRVNYSIITEPGSTTHYLLLIPQVIL